MNGRLKPRRHDVLESDRVRRTAKRLGEQPLVFQIAFQPPDEIVRPHRRIEFRQREHSEHLQRRLGVAS